MEYFVVFSKEDEEQLKEGISNKIPIKFYKIADSNLQYFTIDGVFLNLITEDLSKIILEKAEGIFWKNIIKKYYPEVSFEKQIENSIKRSILTEENTLNDIIAGKLQDMTKISNMLSINGFLNFCLSDVYAELEFIVNEVLEEFYTEKEYYDFIDLLTYYIEVEEPCMKELNILISEENNYTFFDEDFINITQECIDIFYNEFWSETPISGDFLISILLVKTPRKINIYGSDNIQNKNILKTLKYIFKEKISIYKKAEDVYVKNI